MSRAKGKAVAYKGVIDLINTVYTQTFATANDTHAARTAAALTDNTTGEAPDGTIADVAVIALSTSDTYTDAAVNAAVNAVVDDVINAIGEIADQINKLTVDQANTAQFLNQLVDDLQAVDMIQVA